MKIKCTHENNKVLTYSPLAYAMAIIANLERLQDRRIALLQIVDTFCSGVESFKSINIYRVDGKYF